MNKSIQELPYYTESLNQKFQKFCDYMDRWREVSLLQSPDLEQDMPNIALFGNTGAGKSSLFNRIFAEEGLSPVGIEPCTRDMFTHTLSSGRHKIRIVDFPGIGEGVTGGVDYEEMYQELYTRIGPQVDGVFWVLNINERKERENTAFILKHIRNSRGRYLHLPVVILLNKADKTHPRQDYDKDNARLSETQLKTFNDIRDELTKALKLDPRFILPVSAKYNMGIDALLPTLFQAIGEAHDSDTLNFLWR